MRRRWGVGTIWALAIGLAGATCFSGVRAQAGDEPDEPAVLWGASALQAAGPALPQIARAYGWTPSDLAGRLRADPRLLLDGDGRLHYGCSHAPAPLRPDRLRVRGASSRLTRSLDDAFHLHSRPTSRKVIYLDFDGHVTSGTSWNKSYRGGKAFSSEPWDLDGNPSHFDEEERQAIVRIWEQVGEDFAPFDVDVTTQEPDPEGLRKTSDGDPAYGVRVVITPSDGLRRGAGGTAYLDSFDWKNDTPCFVFSNNLWDTDVFIAESVSHEVGHTFGLAHDGIQGGDPYFEGQGNWAPIMGVSYYCEVTQWSRGEYGGANNPQDDVQLIARKGVGFRPDDHGDTPATATPVESGYAVLPGVIETSADRDLFRFATGAGEVEITALPVATGPNLDLRLELLDSSGAVLASAAPESLGAELVRALPAGTYFLRLDGVGDGDPVFDGYSDYASLGQYSLVIELPSWNRPPTAVAGLVSPPGGAPSTVQLSATGSADPDGALVAFDWSFGDGWTGSGPTVSHTYSQAGNYIARLTVTDDGGATATAEVPVSVNLRPDAVASADVTAGQGPLVVRFDGSGSTDPDGTVTGFAWEFGDGASSTEAAPVHAFTAEGVHTVRLTVTDNLGGQDTTTLTVQVQGMDLSRVLRVSTLTVKRQKSPKGKMAKVEVGVTDGNNRPVSGARVTGQFTGVVSGVASGPTGGTKSTAVLLSSPSRKRGAFQLTVTGIEREGCVYVPAFNARTSLSGKL